MTLIYNLALPPTLHTNELCHQTNPIALKIVTLGITYFRLHLESVFMLTWVYWCFVGYGPMFTTLCLRLFTFYCST